MAQDRKRGVTIGGAFLAFAFVLAALTALFLGEWNASRTGQQQAMAGLSALNPTLPAQEQFYELVGKRDLSQPGRLRMSLDIVVLPPVTRERAESALLQAEAEARAVHPDVGALLLFAFPSPIAQRQGARPIASLEWAADRLGFEGTRPSEHERDISVETSLLR